MKKLIAAAALAGCVLSVSAMADCLGDQAGIITQIQQYGSVTTHAIPGYPSVQLQQVFGAFESTDYPDLCGAYGYGTYGSYVVAWQEGNWGNTIAAGSVDSSKKLTVHVAKSLAAQVQAFSGVAVPAKKK